MFKKQLVRVNMPLGLACPSSRASTQLGQAGLTAHATKWLKKPRPGGRAGEFRCWWKSTWLEPPAIDVFVFISCIILWNRIHEVGYATIG